MIAPSIPSIPTVELAVLNSFHSPLLLKMYVVLFSITTAIDPTEHDLILCVTELFVLVGSSAKSVFVSHINFE